MKNFYDCTVQYKYISDSLYLLRIINNLNVSVTFQKKLKHQYYTGSNHLYIADIHCNNVLTLLTVINFKINLKRIYIITINYRKTHIFLKNTNG